MTASGDAGRAGQPGAAARRGFIETVLETIDVGIVSCDADGVIVVRNRAEREMFDILGRLDGRHLDEVPASIDVLDADGHELDPADYPLMRALRGEVLEPVELAIGPKGGPHMHVTVRARQITGPDGEVLGAVAALTDVTAERAAARELADEHDRLVNATAFLDAVTSASPDYTYVTDLVNGAVVWGSKGKELLGVTTGYLETLSLGELRDLVHPADHEGLRDAIRATQEADDGEVVQLRYRGKHADGGWRWLSRRLTPFRRDGEGAVTQVLSVVRDVTDVVEAENRLLHAAAHDILTGLPNRAQLMTRLEEALERGRADGREIAVLFCDLDGFKQVNDSGGHAAGDAVLLETAQRLRSVLRKDDVVARAGGDEFVLIVEPWDRLERSPAVVTGVGARAVLRADRELSLQVAERVAEVMREPIRFRGTEYVVTVSVGVSYAGAAATADELLHDADVAMYQAKDAGKNRVEVAGARFGGAAHGAAAPRSRALA